MMGVYPADRAEVVLGGHRAELVKRQRFHANQDLDVVEVR